MIFIQNQLGAVPAAATGIHNDAIFQMNVPFLKVIFEYPELDMLLQPAAYRIIHRRKFEPTQSHFAIVRRYI
jgi:hypothetical protein